MSSGDEERDRRRGQPVDILGDEVDGDVCGEVVDSVERSVQCRCEPLGRAHTDHERTGQSRPGRHGYGVDFGQLHLGDLTRRGDGRADGLHMRPGSDLGHDSAEADVLVHR